MLTVAVETYGDFDVPILDSIFISEDFNSISETGLSKSYFDPNNDTEPLKKELKKLGFKEQKFKTITATDEN